MLWASFPDMFFKPVEHITFLTSEALSFMHTKVLRIIRCASCRSHPLTFHFHPPQDVVIPHMAWEASAATALSLSFAELRYVLAILLAIPISACMRFIRNPTARRLFSVTSGVLLVLYPFGRGVLQLAFPTLCTYLAMLLAPRRCALIAWMTVFPYLVWLQLVTASGMACNTGDVDFVGGVMVLTLKLISMAASYQDGHSRKPEALTAYQSAHKIARLPSPLSFLSFVFGLGNLLCGPAMEFAEYDEFMRLDGVWRAGAKGRAAPLGLAHGAALILQGLGFMGLHITLISKLGWGVQGDTFWFRNPSYLTLPLPLRLGCQVVCGFAHQVKYYFLWKLSEAANILSGFDFLGHEEGTARWGRSTNVRFLGMWLADSSRIVPQHWNIRTGVFLRHYVYDRLVGPTGRAGFVHVLITQLFTAFWHGVYPGYVIFFLGTVFYLQAGTVIYRAERALLPPAVMHSWPWWLLKVAWTDAAVCYMAMAFVILEARKSLEVHADVWFIPHIVMLGLCLAGPFLPKAGKPKEKKQ